MTGPEMMIASLVRVLGIKPEIANEAVANVNGRVNGAMRHFDARLVALEEGMAKLHRHFGILPDQLPMIEQHKDAAE